MTGMNNIQPGDVVMCVDDRSPNSIVPDRPVLRRGHLYRVAKITHGDKTGKPMLGLDEHAIGNGLHWCWYADRFRKINDEPDDIALIARIKLCRPVRERAHSDAVAGIVELGRVS